jgi:tripeptide aminopeptidase
VEIDDLGNVYGRRPGRRSGARPVLVTAHTDTVFPSETPLHLTRAEDRISGPGIGDNALGVAGLFGLHWWLGEERLPGDLLLVANVGEEGLGDLCGMRRVIDRLGQQVRATIVLEGMALGHIYHAAIGVRRYRIAAHTDGGHSWLHFGRPSAIHALLKLGARIAEMHVTDSPKTTFNVGTITGGTSINTIAREAAFDLDLRSESPAVLAQLAAQVEQLAREYDSPEVQVDVRVIGERPAGAIEREHPLVQLAAESLEDVGLRGYSFESGSTDANIPLSRGLPCVVLGLTRGGNSHRPDEFIETRHIERGMQSIVQVVRGAYSL